MKDGGTGRKRNSRSNRKVKGDSEVKEKSDEKRCAKIADFLVEGKKGVDLEAALKEWEGNKVKASKGEKAKPTNERVNRKVAQDVGDKREIIGTEQDKSTVVVQGREVANNVANDIAAAYKADIANLPFKNRCLSPDASPDLRFKVPLTAMFRRSLSAPASHTRSPAQGTFPSALHATRRGSFASAASYMLSSQYETSLSPLSPIEQHEATPTCYL